MRIKTNDTMFVYQIHLGMTREGQPFLESDCVRNVLGDVPHNECMKAVMGVLLMLLNEFMAEHFGDPATSEVGPHAEPTVDEVMDFFDRNREISDE